MIEAEAILLTPDGQFALISPDGGFVLTSTVLVPVPAPGPVVEPVPAGTSGPPFFGILCDEPPALCVEGNPFANLSAEGPDAVRFVGQKPTPVLPDPGVWERLGCLGVCYSSVSQEDADLCAEQQSLLCVNPSLFFNVEQSCAAACPDGTLFTFMVAAGRFAAPSQALADEQARSYACREAERRKVCFSPLGKCSVCLGEFITIGVAVDSDEGVASWVVTGDLPTGMVFNADPGSSTGVFAGIPQQAGNYEFQLTVVTPAGSFMTKTFTIGVLTISTLTLAGFRVGTPYSFQLQAAGGSGAYAWRIVSGSLPPGLVLDLNGTISGTPQSATTSSLVFEVRDTACEAVDKSFYAPRVTLSATSQHAIATVRGFAPYGAQATPPRRYKRLEWTGSSEQWATPWDDAPTGSIGETTTTALFVVPAKGSMVSISVVDSSFYTVGDLVGVGDGVTAWGTFKVEGVAGLLLSLRYLDTLFNTHVGDSVAAGAYVGLSDFGSAGRARYDYEGASQIDGFGNFTSRYTKKFYAGCSEATHTPGIQKAFALLPGTNGIPNVLKGYCWPYDPQSCPECAEPLELVADVAANSPSDASDFISIPGQGTVTTTPTSYTVAKPDTGWWVALEPSHVINFPLSNFNGDTGYWLFLRASHAYSATLSDEYTDVEAMLHAQRFTSNGKVAENHPRTTGLVSTTTSVTFRLSFTNLLAGEEYVARVRLLSDTGVVTLREYSFTASDDTHLITDVIGVPAPGRSIEVRQPEVAYAP